MKRSIALAGILCALAIPASAGTSKGKYPVCISENAYDRLSEALLNGATKTAEKMVSAGLCLILKPGLRMSVADYGFLSVSKFTLVVDGEMVHVWGPSEEYQQ